MNIKKSLLSLALAIAISAPTFAISPDAFTKPNKAAIKQIENIIQKMDFDIDEVKDLTIKIKFMVNEDSELIVLSTGESKFDSKIKGALNYKSVDNEGLEQYKVYILPVRFEPEA